MPARRHRLDQETGHAAVARRRRVVGRLQRGVEGDAHLEHFVIGLNRLGIPKGVAM
jgi:hypothetical protein